MALLRSAPWTSRVTILQLVQDIDAGTPIASAAARFHNGLAVATADACARIAARTGMDLAVLSGGVFQNLSLLERTTGRLEEHGLRVLRPRLLPPSDGGISYGQAAVAAARLPHRA